MKPEGLDEEQRKERPQHRAQYIGEIEEAE
jgi:hypothetical protein